MRFVTKKAVKPLDECIVQKMFIIPRDKANSFDIVTGEKCLDVQINGKHYVMPVDRPTPIDYNAFCLLRDLNIIDYGYEVGGAVEQL